MVGILSHVVEFRNHEGGDHIRSIRGITELLLRRLVEKTKAYHLSEEDIALIKTASALHDIGKITIPEEILNKPGKLTPEEFAVMKTHAAAGAVILEQMTFGQEKPLFRYALEICRWHHERWTATATRTAAGGTNPHRRAGGGSGRCLQRADQRAVLQKSL